MKTGQNFNTRSLRILASLLIFVSSYALGGDLLVSPMLIEIEDVGPTVRDFSFSVTGQTEAQVKLSFFDMSQLESGYMAFREADISNAESLASWVVLEDDSFRIRAGETKLVNGKINVPIRAAGTYLLSIMVEEDIPEDASNGVAVTVRYAVVINLKVDGAINRRIKTGFEELVVVNTGNEKHLEGMFSNESKIDEWLDSEVQIRTEKNELIERVKMRTESAWQRNDTNSRVFPGAKVRIFGKMQIDVEPGDYKVIVRNRFADKSQPVYRDTLRIEERLAEKNVDSAGIALVDRESELPVEISPAALPVEIRSNGTSFSSFTVTNRSDQLMFIDLPKELEGLEEKGISEFKFFPDSVQIRPGKIARIVLQQTHLNGFNYEGVTFEAMLRTDDVNDQRKKLNLVTVGNP
ncbi:MAG: hypothetical protein ACI85S_001419 [Pseudohongiellaceae bacterium]